MKAILSSEENHGKQEPASILNPPITEKNKNLK
jgi:hypothetical protein